VGFEENNETLFNVKISVRLSMAMMYSVLFGPFSYFISGEYKVTIDQKIFNFEK